MRIVILLNTSWNIYNFRMGIIRALQQKGHEVIAVAPHDDYVPLLENENVKCFPILLNSKSTNPLTDLKLAFSYFKILKKIKPDVILSYTIKPNIYGNFAAQVLGIKTVNNVSGLGTLFIDKNLSTRIGAALYKAAFLKANWVFFQNSVDRELFLNKKLVQSSNSGIIPGSGVDTLVFKRNKKQNKGRVILFVGRLIGDKGIREFIESAKILLQKYDDLHFKIVGEYGYNNRTAVGKEELEEWLKIHQIEYLGKVDNMQDVYRNVDIMVLPSYREGLSKSLIEACAMGIPIVTTNVPGCNDVVEHGMNGYLCNPKDSIDLAEKIFNLIQLPEEERLLMGARGRKIAEEKYDERIVVEKYMERIKLL